jgi:hypothetical protein
MPTFQTIIQTSNSTNNAAPGTADIEQGELAINLVDGKIYTKDTTNAIRTLNRLASTDAGTSGMGSISSYISENTEGVGINISGQTGIDLTVDGGSGSDGVLKVTNKILVPTIFRSVDTDFLKLSGGTGSGISGANIELYGANRSPSSEASNCYIDSEIFYVRDIAASSTKYIELGSTSPEITIGGPNTTGAATLKIGDGRASDGNSEIIFQSLATDATIKPHIVRDNTKDFKIVNHGAGDLILSADTGKKIMLQTTAADSATVDHVSLIARDGFVLVGNLTTSDDVGSTNELEVKGDAKADSIVLDNDNAIFLGSGKKHLITHDDGVGIVNIRGGHKVDQSETPSREEFTHTGTAAAYIGEKNLGSATGAKVEIKVSTDATPTADNPVTWGTAFVVQKEKAYFEGKVGIKTTSPGGDLHVVGNGGLDNVLFEANAPAGADEKEGARITLRTSGGTNAAKGNSIDNSKLGEVNFQGFQGSGFVTGARIVCQTLNAWTGPSDHSAELLVKVRQVGTEVNAIKVFGTDGGKVCINSPVVSVSANNPSLHIGGSQKLGVTAGNFIEHLRLDADTGYGVENDNPSDGDASTDINNHDKLIFRHYRKTTDDATPTSATSRFRIQRLDTEDFATTGSATSRSNGYIDFGHNTTTNSAGDTNLGEDMISFGTGGLTSSTEYFRIDNSGRLTQYGTDASVIAQRARDLVIGKSTSSDSGMTILSSISGKCNINFNDGENSSVRGLITYENSGDRLSFSTAGEGYLDVGDDPFNGMSIGSNGFVGIGLTGTNPVISQRLHVNGQILAEGDITAFSDERLKENITTIPNALEKVTQLRGVQYTRKDTQQQGIGVIAQEIEKVLPEVVITNNDEDKTKSVAYGNVVGLLIEAVKDLQKEVEELKRNVTK